MANNNFEVRNGAIIFREKILDPKAWADTTKLRETKFQRDTRELIESIGVRGQVSEEEIKF